jgi:hypothetical protein
VANPRNKKFRLAASDIKRLAPGHGGCIASDMITVDGRHVGFMYREEEDFEGDSGWRFMSGYESEEYSDDPNNAAVYDVNTIANYDPKIIRYLDRPVGSAFERETMEGEFSEVFDFDPTEE